MLISAVVLTKDEEKNIEKCLESLDWCDEIVVIDDYSNDKTVSLAEGKGARVFLRRLEDNFARQRNYGLKRAKGEWTLFIDADERVTAGLKEEIQSSIRVFSTDDRLSKKHKIGKSVGGYQGFVMRRKDKFLGKWLRFGETSSIRLLRLARKNSGQWAGPVHETWEVKGKLGRLGNPILHERQLTISQFLKRINLYSSIRAKELFQDKKKTNAFLIIAYPLGKFLQNYFFRLGFLDGMPGLIMALIMSLHSFLVRGKLYLLWKNKGGMDYV